MKLRIMAKWRDCYDTIRQVKVSECRAMCDVILKEAPLRFHVTETKKVTNTLITRT